MPSHFQTRLTLLFLLTFVTSFARAQVDPRSGVYRKAWTDFTLPGVRQLFDVRRIYNPVASPGVLFKGPWCSNFDLKIVNGGTDFPKLSTCETTIFFERDRSALPAQVFRSRLNPAVVLTQTKIGESRHYSLKISDERSMEFSSEGILTEIKYVPNEKLSLKYDGDHLREISNGAKSVHFKYSDGGVLTDLVSPLKDRSVEYRYDKDEHLIGVSNAAGANLTYEYDSANRLAKISSSAASATEILKYSGDKFEVSRYEDQLKCIETFTRTMPSVLTQPGTVDVARTCPTRAVEKTSFNLWYDSLTNAQPFVIREIIKTTRREGKLLKQESLEREFDPHTKLLTSQKVGDQLSQFDYDHNGRVIQIKTTPALKTIKLVYTDDDLRPAKLILSQPKSKKDEIIVSTEYAIEYNPKKQVESLTGQVISAGIGKTKKPSPPMIARFEYDANDRLTHMKDAKGTFVLAKFSPDGVPLKIERRNDISEEQVGEWSSLLNVIRSAREKSELF